MSKFYAIPRHYPLEGSLITYSEQIINGDSGEVWGTFPRRSLFFSVLEIDADGFWSAAAQAVDEIGEADLTGAAEALGGDNRLNLRNARVEIAVDDDVIVFRPVAHFFGGFRHARGDGGGAVLGAGAQARFERGHVGRQDKHGHEIARHGFGELLGSLPIDVGDDVAAGGDRLVDRAARRAVAMTKDGGMLEELAGLDHRIEARLVDKAVIGAVGLAGAGGARRHRHRQGQVRVALDKAMRDRRLAGTRGRGQHQQKTAAADRGGRLRLARCAAHSRFCTCSRNCSIAAFSDRPMRVNSISADFEHSVLASRFNSWHRKSSSRPIASPRCRRSPACAIWACNRSNSSRTSARVTSIANSCATRSSETGEARPDSSPRSASRRARIAAGCPAAEAEAASTRAASRAR